LRGGPAPRVVNKTETSEMLTQSFRNNSRIDDKNRKMPGNTYIISHLRRAVHVETLKGGKEASKEEFPKVSVDEAYDTLKSMRVHGAGRIARFAAQALRDYAKDAKAKTSKEYWALVLKAGEKLRSARPTAVSLPNGVNYVLYGGRTSFESGASVDDVASGPAEPSSGSLTESSRLDSCERQR